MQVGTLNATYRATSGKGANRKLRATGMVPAICYGKDGEPIQLAVDPAALTRALDPEKRANTLITLKIAKGDGYTGPDTLTVMLRDWQENPLRGDVIHADFQRVRTDEEVHATVPIAIVGKAEGVKNGGTLHQVFRSLEIACTPDKIPSKIEVNVDALNLGEAIHVRDLKLGEGVRPLLDGGQTICTVTIPRAEKAAEAAAPAEGAAAAPAAGAAAAPAAGAKPAAGAAAAKPAAGGEKAAPAKPAGGKK